MASHQTRTATICPKCNLALTGYFVRALNAKFHVDCFACFDCGKPTADKFFPLEHQSLQVPTCETCYFKRLDLLCASCGCALRHSYVLSPNNRKYHLEHLKCPRGSCRYPINKTEACYKDGDRVHCCKHYCAKAAKICKTCSLPILPRFVDSEKIVPKGFGHPYCELLHKHWDVTWSGRTYANTAEMRLQLSKADESEWAAFEKTMESSEKLVQKTWIAISSFEQCMGEQLSSFLSSLPDEKFPTVVLTRLVAQIECLCKAITLVNDACIREELPGVRCIRPLKLVEKSIARLVAILHPSQASTEADIKDHCARLAQSLKDLIKAALQSAIQGPPGTLPAFFDIISTVSEADWNEHITLPLVFWRLNQIRKFKGICSCRIAVRGACYYMHQTKSRPHRTTFHPDCLNCGHCEGILPKDRKLSAMRARKMDWIGSLNNCPFCNQPWSPALDFVPSNEYYLAQLWGALHYFPGMSIKRWERVLKEASRYSAPQPKILELGEALSSTLKLDELARLYLSSK